MQKALTAYHDRQALKAHFAGPSDRNGKIRAMKKYRSRAKRRTNLTRVFLLILGIGLLIASLILALYTYTQFTRQAEIIPYQTSLLGIPIGGLAPEQAAQRIEEVYSLPVELRYKDARIQFQPSDLGFNLETQATLAQLPERIRPISFQTWFWGKLAAEQSRQLEPIFTLDANQLEKILIGTFPNRYDQSSSSPVPILHSTNFLPGQPGTQLSSITQTIEQVKRALLSPSDRTIELSLTETPVPPLNWHNLEVMLRQILNQERFNGLAEIYLRDLATDQTMHFAIQNQMDVPVDVAYSAASTIKIPIMISTMKRLGDPLPAQATNWMRQMISESLNPPADGLMKAYMDNNRGPLMVTADLREMGYENTFLAGYFEPGSPLLERINTPANQRTDINLDPDFYNQTVPSETGDLLARLYHCSISADSPLLNGQVTQSECSLMLAYLKENKILALLEAGLPPDVQIAHKHGWTNEIDGLIHTMSDASVIYTPGGDYVLVVFAHTQNQFLYDTANRLFARLSQSIYNAYNLDNQTFWYEN